ncbi:MAG: prefoldin subunit alpha [Candidatus Geothermarchaeota archaeon]
MTTADEENLAILLYEQRRLVEMMESLYAEISILQRSLLEYNSALEILNMYKSCEKGREFDTLLPIGGQVYLPVKMSVPNAILVGIGIGIFVKKSIESSINYLMESIKEITNALNERINVLNQLKNKYEEITSAIIELQFKLRERREAKSH